MTGPELNRLSGAARFMARVCPQRGRLWFLSTARGSSREEIDQVQGLIAKAQRASGLPVYRVTVFEGSGGLHAHMVFVADGDIVERLRRLEVLDTDNGLQRVTDLHGLVHRYFAKERTPQAGFRRSHRLGGRLRGSHSLDGGGDRVRLSRKLERDAIEAGYVEPWQHSHAKRKEGRARYSLRSRGDHARAPAPSGQLILLPEAARPVSRLRDFGGGFIPPAAACEIEFLRRRSGLTQAALAALIGRSQGQLANALRGHDPISARAVNRLREVLLPSR